MTIGIGERGRNSAAVGLEVFCRRGYYMWVLKHIRMLAGLMAAGALAPGAVWADVAGDVAAAVLRGDLSQARALVERAAGAENSSQVAGLRRSVVLVQQMGDRILSSFQGELGQMVNVELTSGSEIVQVRQVEGNSVRVVRRVGTDDASEWTVTLDQLAAAEKLRRLGQGSGPEVNLLRGLVAWGGRDRAGAMEYFRAAGADPLATAIIDMFSQGAKQKAEAAARDALGRLLRVAGLAPGTALDQKTASGIRRQTFPEKDLERIRSAADAFRREHGGTDVAKAADVVVVELARVDAVTREIDSGMIDARASRLKEANPGLGDAKIERRITQAGAELSLAGNAGLTNIAVFGDLPLVRLDLSDCGVSDIGPLRRMPLQELSLARCPVADLSALRGRPLQRLDLTGTGVSDLGPIEGAPLQHLVLAGCDRIADLSAVVAFRRLQTLVLPSRSVDPGVLKGHRSLKSIGYSVDALVPVAEFWSGTQAR